MNVNDFKVIINKNQRLLTYLLLAVGGICCLVSLILFVGNKSTLSLLAEEAMAPVTALEATMDGDQTLPGFGEENYQEGSQEGSQETSPQNIVVDLDDDSWQAEALASDSGFIVHADPSSEESGLHTKKEEIVEVIPYDPPPPRAVDKSIMQAIITRTKEFKTKTASMSKQNDSEYQDIEYYEELAVYYQDLHEYLPEYAKEFFTLLKDNQYFSYAELLQEAVTTFYMSEGYDAKDFRGSAETRQYLDEWIERVEALVGT